MALSARSTAFGFFFTLYCPGEALPILAAARRSAEVLGDVPGGFLRLCQLRRELIEPFGFPIAEEPVYLFPRRSCQLLHLVKIDFVKAAMLHDGICGMYHSGHFSKAFQNGILPLFETLDKILLSAMSSRPLSSITLQSHHPSLHHRADSMIRICLLLLHETYRSEPCMPLAFFLQEEILLRNFQTR